MTADRAREAADVETLTIPMSEVDRAVLDGEPEGLVRVHHRRGRPVGATIVAAHAGDLIGEIALAITHGIHLGKLSGTIHPYPTQAEVMRKAGDQYRRGALTPRVKKLLGLWFRLFG
jgi:pyruvate/2-oxoglutarate dehydrogenase complex dihydrolipoamide dehydrogenase (E3) component